MTPQQKATLNAVKALADCIRELGSVPSGHLYATVMEYMSLEQYQAFVDALKGADLVREEPSHLLVWIGPQQAPQQPQQPQPAA